MRYAFGDTDVNAVKFADLDTDRDGNIDANCDTYGFTNPAGCVQEPGSDLHDIG